MASSGRQLSRKKNFSRKISRKRFNRWSRNITGLSRTISRTNLPLAPSDRLQNVIEYYTAVRKAGPASKESNNSATVRRKIITNDTQNVCRYFKVEWPAFCLVSPTGGFFLLAVGECWVVFAWLSFVRMSAATRRSTGCRISTLSCRFRSTRTKKSSVCRRPTCVEWLDSPTNTAKTTRNGQLDISWPIFQIFS